MEQELYDCCILAIQLLKKLFEDGKITKEEYEKHIKLKVEFINSFPRDEKISK